MENINQEKLKKHRENEEKRGKIDKIETSIGWIKTKTKIGNLKNCLQELKTMIELRGKIRKNLLYFCDEFGETFDYEPIDKEESAALYEEIVKEHKKIDRKFLSYKKQIDNTKTKEDLEKLTIEY